MLLTMAAVAYRLDPASDPDSAALAWIIIAMDYDQSGIATTYDEARALTPARRRRWQRLLSAHVDRTAIWLVVDLGCGTGRFTEMLAAELGARVIGLDPSEKMIDEARRKPATSPVVFGRASAHELPLPRRERAHSAGRARSPAPADRALPEFAVPTTRPLHERVNRGRKR